MKPVAIIPLVLAFLLGLLTRRRSQVATIPAPAAAEDAPTADVSPAVSESDGPTHTEPGVFLAMYGWLKEHFWFVSLAATALAAFLGIVKALVLAEGDLSTATILLSDGISGVFLSAFIASLPFMALGAVTTTGFAFAQAWREGVSTWPPVAVFLTAIALCLTVTPWWMALTAAAVVVTPVLMFSSGNVTTSINSAGWTGLWFLALIGVLTGAITGQWITMGKMWIPAESILIQAASTDPAAAPTTDQMIGYVISEEGSYLTVLLEEDRHLVYVAADTVLERTRCQLEESEWSELPLPWGGAVNKYSRC